MLAGVSSARHVVCSLCRRVPACVSLLLWLLAVASLLAVVTCVAWLEALREDLSTGLPNFSLSSFLFVGERFVPHVLLCFKWRWYNVVLAARSDLPENVLPEGFSPSQVGAFVQGLASTSGLAVCSFSRLVSWTLCASPDSADAVLLSRLLDGFLRRWAFPNLRSCLPVTLALSYFRCSMARFILHTFPHDVFCCKHALHPIPYFLKKVISPFFFSPSFLLLWLTVTMPSFFCLVLEMPLLCLCLVSNVHCNESTLPCQWVNVFVVLFQCWLLTSPAGHPLCIVLAALIGLWWCGLSFAPDE